MQQKSSGPTSTSDRDHRAAVSILDQLRARTQSNLSRKKKIHELLDCFPVLYTDRYMFFIENTRLILREEWVSIMGIQE